MAQQRLGRRSSSILGLEELPIICRSEVGNAQFRKYYSHRRERYDATEHGRRLPSDAKAASLAAAPDNNRETVVVADITKSTMPPAARRPTNSGEHLRSCRPHSTAGRMPSRWIEISTTSAWGENKANILLDIGTAIGQNVP